jgi:hypothetical protein
MNSNSTFRARARAPTRVRARPCQQISDRFKIEKLKNRVRTRARKNLGWLY